MKALQWLTFIVFVPAGGALAASVSGSVYLQPIESTSFTSIGFAQYINDLGQPSEAVNLGGTHSVSGPQVFQTAVQGAGTYSETLSGPAQAEACYGTTLHATADPPGWFNTIEETFTGEVECAPPNSGTTVVVVGEKCDGMTGMGQPCSPILIDIATGAFPLSGAEAPVAFDLNADGHRNRVMWTEGGSSVAFLARDRNRNGRIDDGSELFGDSTPLLSGVRAANGFEAMKDLDSNGDGLLTEEDDRFAELLLWTDWSHDGISQPSEMQQLAASPVRALETRYRWSGRRDADGNEFRYRGIARLERGSRSIYDVYFRSVP